MEKVIIYRSRSEAAIDEMIWNNNGSLVEPFAFLIIGVVIFMSITRIAESIHWRHWQKTPDWFKKFYNKHYNWVNLALTVPLTFLGFKLFKIVIML